MRRTIIVLAALLSLACGERGKHTAVAASQVAPAPSRTVAPATRVPAPQPAPPLGVVYHIGGDITPPELLTKVRPDPDPPCKGHRVQGVAIFEMTIDESGSVSAVHTLRRPLLDPPCPAFEESYRAALSKWKYKPATRDGKPVAGYLTVTVLFHF